MQKFWNLEGKTDKMGLFGWQVVGGACFFIEVSGRLLSAFGLLPAVGGVLWQNTM